MKSFKLLTGLSLLLTGVQASLFGNFWPRQSQNCTLYTVQFGDTCFGIASNNNATYAQIVAWNSEINTFRNLGNLTNSTICISNPLGNFALPTNVNGQTSIVTTAVPIPTPTVDGTNPDCGQYYYVQKGDGCSSATALPNVGDILANYTSTQPMIPIANDTRVDCYSYIYFDNLTNNGAADCWALSMIYGITGGDFILWNPSLAESNESLTDTASISATASAIAAAATANTTATATSNVYAYPCTLSANTSYCVALMSPTAAPASTSAPPSPRAAGETANCTSWYTPQSFDTCSGILTNFYLTIAEFYAMNPSVGSDCTGMNLGTYYCISTYPGGIPPGQPYSAISASLGLGNGTSTMSGSSTTGIVTPTPTQSGMVGDCDEFYDVAGGDTCYGIAQSYSIAQSNFYSWNPAVSTDCSGLQASVYVCVGVEATTTGSVTTTPTTSSTATGIVTPSPIQSGMVTDCDKFYDVASGDGCYAIAQSYSIALTDFYSWNPAVSTDCSGLQASVYVCVEVEATATTTTPTQSGMVSDCDKFYYVEPDDGCYNIATAEGIALSDFYAWNPAVKDDCSGLEAEYYVCVGIS